MARHGRAAAIESGPDLRRVTVAERDASAPTELAAAARRIRFALWIGAALWLCLLVAGFFAPGGWTWGMPGPVGHMENYVISLWLVVLVVAPLLAARDPSSNLPAMRVYVLGVLAIVLSTIRGETPKLIATHPRLPRR
ncbi:MAG: hypothetical protein JOY61_04550 [Chloroflexi bacterium]|nr:hypothetical protein [Chloroflexota bacterium]